LKFVSGPGIPGFPYPNYPESFPSERVELLPITPDIQKIIILMNEGREEECDEFSRKHELYMPKNQIGGIPLLLQGATENPKCQNCRLSMPFLICISNRASFSNRFTDYDYVQVIFYFCSDCQVVSAFQACD